MRGQPVDPRGGCAEVEGRGVEVRIDRSKCQGYANCMVEAPDIFDLDEDAKAMVIRQPESTEREDVQRAARSCPVEAIQEVE